MSKILISLEVSTEPPYTIFFREEGDTQFTVLEDDLQKESFPLFHRKIDGKEIEVGTTVEYIIGDSILDDPLSLPQAKFDELLFSCEAKPEPEIEVIEEGIDFLTVSLVNETSEPYILGRDETILLSEDAEFPFREEGLESDTEYTYMITDACLQMDEATGKTLPFGELVIITLEAEDITSEAATIKGEIEAVSGIRFVGPRLRWSDTNQTAPEEDNIVILDNNTSPQPGDVFSKRLEDPKLFVRERLSSGLSDRKAVSIDPGSERIAVASQEDHQVRVYGEEFDFLDILRPAQYNTNPGTIPEGTADIVYNPTGDGRLATITREDNVLRIYDSNFQLEDTTVASSDGFPTSAMDWDEKSGRIAVGFGPSRNVEIFTPVGGAFTSSEVINVKSEGEERQEGLDTIKSVAWDSTTGKLAVGSGSTGLASSNESLFLFNSSLSLLAQIDRINNGFSSLDWNDQNGLLAVGEDNGVISVLRVSSGSFDKLDEIDLNQFGSATSSVLDDVGQTQIAWDEEKDLIQVAFSDGNIYPVEYDGDSEVLSVDTNNILVNPAFVGDDRPSRPISFDLVPEFGKAVVGTEGQRQGGDIPQNQAIAESIVLEYEGTLKPGVEYYFQAFGISSDPSTVPSDEGEILDFETPSPLSITTGNFSEDGVPTVPVSGEEKAVASTFDSRIDEINSAIAKAGGLDFSFEFGDSDFSDPSNAPNFSRSIDPQTSVGDPEVSLGDISNKPKFQSNPNPAGINGTAMDVDPTTGRVAVSVLDNADGREDVVVYTPVTSSGKVVNYVLETVLSNPDIPNNFEINALDWGEKNGRLAVGLLGGEGNQVQVFDSDLNLIADANNEFSLLFGNRALDVDFDPVSGRLALVTWGSSAFQRRTFIFDENFNNFARLEDTANPPVSFSAEWDPASGKLAIGKAEEFTDNGRVLVYNGLRDADLNDVDLSSNGNIDQTITEPAHDVSWSNNGKRFALATGATGVVEVYDATDSSGNPGGTLSSFKSIAEVGKIDNPPQSKRPFIAVTESQGNKPSTAFYVLTPDGITTGDPGGGLITTGKLGSVGGNMASNYDDTVWVTGGISIDLHDAKTGTIISSLDVDGGRDCTSDTTGNVITASAGNGDGPETSPFLTKASRGGVVIWQERLQTIEDDGDTRIELDSDLEDNIYVAFRFSTPGFFGEDRDGYVQKRDGDSGSLIWEHRFERTTDNDVGIRRSPVAYDPVDDAVYSTSNTEEEIIKVRASDGIELLRYGHVQNQIIRTMDVDSHGNLWVGSYISNQFVDPKLYKYSKNGVELIRDIPLKGKPYDLKVDYEDNVIVGQQNGYVEKWDSSGIKQWEYTNDDDSDGSNFIFGVAPDLAHDVRNVEIDSTTGWMAIPKRGKLQTSVYDDTQFIDFVKRIDTAEVDAQTVDVPNQHTDVAWNTTAELDEDGVKLLGLPRGENNITAYEGPVLFKKDEQYYFRARGEKTAGNTNYSDQGNVVPFIP